MLKKWLEEEFFRYEVIFINQWNYWNESFKVVLSEFIYFIYLLIEISSMYIEWEKTNLINPI